MRRDVAILGLALAACSGGNEAGVPGDVEDTQPFSVIGEGESVRFTGTEPFWGGEVAGTTLVYTTPDNIDGTTIEVARFAGRGGLTFSGAYQGSNFDLLLVEGACSDGMSDRSYPFVATLSLGGEVRNGCAWSEEHPFTGPENP